MARPFRTPGRSSAPAAGAAFPQPPAAGAGDTGTYESDRSEACAAAGPADANTFRFYQMEVELD